VTGRRKTNWDLEPQQTTTHDLGSAVVFGKSPRTNESALEKKGRGKRRCDASHVVAMETDSWEDNRREIRRRGNGKRQLPDRLYRTYIPTKQWVTSTPKKKKKGGRATNGSRNQGPGGLKKGPERVVLQGVRVAKKKLRLLLTRFRERKKNTQTVRKAEPHF